MARSCSLAICTAATTLFLLLLGSASALQAQDLGRKSIADSSQPEHGEITRVPGFDGPLPSRHYGGYVTVGGRRRLYYYMVQSERDPGADPVLLWMNGGPGCSSFDGFIYELGPFNFAFADASYKRLKLSANPYAWSKVATVVFLDSPAGVGLSYSDEPADYRTNDTQTAVDTDAFLRGFFDRYPELQGRDFYIAGESYAGVYVPNAARAVLEGNRRGLKPRINLAAYIVGNGVTDAEYDGNAIVPFAAGKSLLSQAMFNKARRACDGGSFWNARDGSECAERLDGVWKELAPLNRYNILEECHHGPPPPQQQQRQQQQQQQQQQQPANGAEAAAVAAAAAATAARHERLAAAYAAAFESAPHPRTWPLGAQLPPRGAVVPNWAQLLRGLGHNPPCTDATAGDVWLNDPAVRRALHAAPVEVVGAPWTVCSDRTHYTHDAGSMLPLHRELTQRRGLRALIFSGDHDMAVPHTGSEAWTRGLGLKKLSKWAPWYVGSPRQVAGYAVHYKGLTYATVKGAGHMVPQNKPAEALEMLSRFLRGEALAPAPTGGNLDDDGGDDDDE